MRRRRSRRETARREESGRSVPKKTARIAATIGTSAGGQEADQGTVMIATGGDIVQGRGIDERTKTGTTDVGKDPGAVTAITEVNVVTVTENEMTSGREAVHGIDIEGEEAGHRMNITTGGGIEELNNEQTSRPAIQVPSINETVLSAQLYSPTIVFNKAMIHLSLHPCRSTVREPGFSDDTDTLTPGQLVEAYRKLVTQ
jgi:hypothetical protein